MKQSGEKTKMSGAEHDVGETIAVGSYCLIKLLRANVSAFAHFNIFHLVTCLNLTPQKPKDE